MTDTGQRAARAAMIALAGAALVFAPQAASADPAAPRSAADCRAISDFALRGQCWDALDKQGLHDEQVVKKRNFGLGAQPPAAAAVVAVKPKKEPRAKKNEPPPETADIRSLSLTLASITDTPRGRILLTATDGAVWEQTDDDAVPTRPSPGDVVQVSKGSFGGFLCHVTRWQTVRCQRDQ